VQTSWSFKYSTRKPGDPFNHQIQMFSSDDIWAYSENLKLVSISGLSMGIRTQSTLDLKLLFNLFDRQTD